MGGRDAEERDDEVLKRYLSDNERYADLINGFCFEGEQIVRAKDLSDRDSQTGYHKKGTAPKGKSNIKTRDLLRKTRFGVNFAVIGVENQQKVHYLMPLRCMEVDIKEYQRQEVKRKNELKAEKGLSEAEYLSRFKREDKLHPCVTIVLYYGDEWDGSKELHDLLDFSEMPDVIKTMVNNYKLNLLDIKNFMHTERFRTDLRQVIEFAKYSKNKEELKKLVEQGESYRFLEEDAYDVIALLANAGKLVSVKGKVVKEGKADMCQAINDLIQDGVREGMARGREEKALQMLQSLMSKLECSLEEAMELLDVEEVKREKYREKIRV